MLRCYARLVAGFAFCVLAACSSMDAAPVRDDFIAGNYDEARKRLVIYEEQDERNNHLWAMERSVVELAMERPEQAVTALRGARDSMRSMSAYGSGGKSGLSDWVRKAGSLLSDDRTEQYSGRDYEQLLLFSLLTLAELMDQGGDTTAYTLQGLEHQLELQEEIAGDTQALYEKFTEYRDLHGENPKDAYRLPAFGDYLRATLLETHPTRLYAAQRAYERVAQLAPDYAFAQDDLARVNGDVDSDPDKGVVIILAMVGRGPFLEERRVQRPEEHLLVLLKQIWNLHKDRASFPIVTGIPVPELRFWKNNPPDAHVFVDGVDVGTTATITDVELSAQAEFEAMRETILARAVIRRAVKLVVGEIGKEALADGSSKKKHRGHGGGGDSALSRFTDLTVAIWTSSERADLRIWSLLPARFQALRLELAPGKHEINLRPSNAEGQPVGQGRSILVDVRRGRQVHVLGILPSMKGGPALLSTDPVSEPNPIPSPAGSDDRE